MTILPGLVTTSFLWRGGSDHLTSGFDVLVGVDCLKMTVKLGGRLSDRSWMRYRQWGVRLRLISSGLVALGFGRTSNYKTPPSCQSADPSRSFPFSVETCKGCLAHLDDGHEAVLLQ